MKGDTALLNQLVNSIEDAVNKIETIQKRGSLEEFNHIRDFILNLQKKVETETDNILQ